MDERISTLVTQVTAGLRADPELCLDVQEEVTRHLEDTVAQFEAEGKGSEESVNDALQVFGSPVELADTIQQANTRRMRLRARLRLAVNALLIPVAVLVALLLCGWQVRRQALIGEYYRGFAGESYNSLSITTNGSFNPPLLASDLAKLLHYPFVFPNTSQEYRNKMGIRQSVGALRANWERHQHDAEGYKYFAYYTGFLEAKPHDVDSAFEYEMQLGESLEPANALYNYKLARYYLSLGVVSRYEKSSKQPQTDELLDQRMMELGIAEYKRGLTKRYLNSYHGFMVKKRLALLPTLRLSEDYLQYISVINEEVLPDYARQRFFARQLTGCMWILAKQGRRDELEPLLNSWKPFGRQYFSTEQETIIQMIVGVAMVNILAKNAAEVETQLGQPQRAAQTQAEVKQYAAPITNWNQQANLPGFDYTHPARKNGSLLTSMLMRDVNDDLTVRELTPLRSAEQALWVELAFSFISLLVLIAMGWAAYRWLVVRIQARGGVTTPLLVLPTRNEFMQIIGYAILLPLLVYALYYAIPFLGRREYGMAAPGMPVQRLGECLVMTLLLLGLPAVLATRAIRRRCHALGVPIPSVWQEYRHNLFLLVTLILAITCLYWMHRSWTQPVEDWMFAIFFMTLILLVAVIFIAVRYVQRSSSFLFFEGTLARSLIPIYALVILLISCAQPYLLHQEAYWFRQDRLIFNNKQSGEKVFGLDYRVTTRLRHEMLQTAKEMGF